MTLATEKVDELFTDWNKLNSPGCAIAIIQDGEVIYSRGYGMANLEHNIPITTTSVFDIGSTSKQFVATGIAILARQSKLSLDDEIQTYLPEIRHYAQQRITIRHLIHHTSGLRDYIILMDLTGFTWDNHCPDEEIISLIARQQELNFAPGTEYLYSNTNYVLLGEIIKRVSGKSLRTFTNEYIFAPLKMNDTHFRDDFREIIKHRAIGYAPKDSGGFKIDMSLLDVVGDGGLHTTVEDLYIWDANFYHNIVGGYGKDLIEDITTLGTLDNGEVINYAFGLEIRTYRGLKKIAHNGGSSGYVSEMCRFPEQRFSVICLSNLNSVNPSKLAHQISHIYLAKEFTEQKYFLLQGNRQFIELSTAELETKTGFYRNVKSGAIWELTVQGEKLMVDAAGFNFQIVPSDRDVYHSVGISYDINIRFEQQSPSSITMSFWIGDGDSSILEKFKPYTSTLDQLQNYAGSYFCEELGVEYQLSIEGNQLAISRKNLSPDSLRQVSYNLFKENDNSFEFICDDRDRVLGFNLNAGGGRVRSINFIKV